MIRKKVGMAFMLACSWAVLLSADESDALGRIAREPSGGRLERLSHITLPFVANQGSSSTVAFWAGGLGGEVMVTPSGTIVHPGARIVERFRGCKEPTVTGVGPSGTRVSVFKGRDPASWKRNLPTYQMLSLGEVYPGIEVELKALGAGVEKVFRVAPGADPGRIEMELSGIHGLSVDDDGRLALDSSVGRLLSTTPVAYQFIDGAKVQVKVAYEIRGENRYGFSVSHYDAGRELVIDPLLKSSFLGGSGSESGMAIAVHPISGDVYVAGRTTSADFPGIDSSSPDDTVYSYEVFVARLDSGLSTLRHCTFLGGSDNDRPAAVAIHPQTGDIYVVGTTASNDFPGVNASSADYVYSSDEAFIARLDMTLSTLYQSTYFGGNRSDYGNDLAIHPRSGDVYIVGTTGGEIPGVDGESADNDYSICCNDGFVARLDRSLHTVYRSTYLGGESYDYGKAIAIHPLTGDVYAAGHTWRDGFPGIDDKSADRTYANGEGFVSRLSESLTSLYRSTYLGGYNEDEIFRMVINPANDSIYVVGVTESLDFPSLDLGSADSRYEGRSEGFVSKLNGGLTSIDRSTYLGGKGEDAAYDIALHPVTWDLYVVGYTESNNFPGIDSVSPDGTFQGYSEAFAARLDSGLKTLYRATFLGGDDDDWGYALAIHPGTLNVYITGETESDDFPAVGSESADRTYYSSEAFVSRWSGTFEQVAVVAGDFDPKDGYEFAVAQKNSDSSLDIYFYRGGAVIGHAWTGPVREMALASGNFDDDRLDELVLACVQEDGTLATILFDSDGSRLRKSLGGVCSNVSVATGHFDGDPYDEYVVSLRQADGTLAAITFDQNGARLAKGVGGVCSSPKLAAGNFDANPSDDEYVIALLQADGTLAAITFQANGQRIGKGVGGPCSQVTVAAGNFRSSNDPQEEYVVSLLQADGTLAAITYTADGTRIGKGVGGVCTNPQVTSGRFARTNPLDGYAVSLIQSSSVPAMIFYAGDGARLGKGTIASAAQSSAAASGDVDACGYDEGVLACVTTAGDVRWVVLDETGSEVLSGP